MTANRIAMKTGALRIAGVAKARKFARIRNGRFREGLSAMHICLESDGRDRDTRAGPAPGHSGQHEVSVMKGHVWKVHLYLLISLPKGSRNL